MRNHGPHRLLVLFSAALVPLLFAHAARADRSWLQFADDLRVDPVLVTGTLDNGLRYAIQRQPHPPGTVSLRLLVLAGSLRETDDESGAAHFVEHMAFNGTTRFPGESLSATLERAGIRFGPEVTAFTWPMHTIYQLELPANDPGKLELGLGVLREWAASVAFDRKQVDRERGVLLAESESRGREAESVRQALVAFDHPDSLLARRPPGAPDAAIRSISADILRRFYHRWYRPDNLVVLVAGDVDPADINARLRDTFGSLPLPPDPLPPLDAGPVLAAPAPAITFFPAPTITTFNAIVTRLVVPPADSLPNRSRALALSLAESIVNDRLRTLSRANPQRFGTLRFAIQQATPYASEMSLQVEGRPLEWEALLSTAEQELRRVELHGFTDTEITEARRTLLSQIEYSAGQRATEPAAAVTNRLVMSCVWHYTPTASDSDADFARATLPTLDAATLAAALRPYFENQSPRVFCYGALPFADPARRLADAWRDSHDVALDPPVDRGETSFAYNDFGPPGAIASHTRDDATDIHLIRFANGVRLNLKRTPFSARTVMMTARLDSGGNLIETPSLRGVAALGQGSLINGGLGRHDAESLQHLLAGHNLSMQFSIEENAFFFRAGADSGQLDLLLRLLTAYLTDPALAPEAITNTREVLFSWIGSARHTPEAALATQGLGILAGDDRRYQPPLAAEIYLRSPAEVARWIQPLLVATPIEIGLVGDFDIDAAIATAAATLGTLPPRGERPPVPAVAFRTKGGRFDLKVETTEDRTALEFAWPVVTDGPPTPRFARTLELLSWVLRASLIDHLREDQRLTYVPETTYWFSRAQPGNGYLIATMLVSRKDAARAIRAVTALTRALERKGVTAADLERARQPALQGIDAQLQDNNYWIQYVVGCAQSDPDALGRPASRARDLAAITADEAGRLARALFPADRMIVITAGP